MTSVDKPAIGDLGIDPGELVWRRSGEADDAIEIAFVLVQGARWVLMRVATGGPTGLIHVFSSHEWHCFVTGAKNGEFDEAAS